MPQAAEPHWLTASEAAESLGITTRAFRAWQVEPVASIGTRRYFDGRTILENRLDALKQRRRRPEGTPAKLKAEADRLETELTRHRAEGQRLRNSEARGEFVTVDALTQAIAKACTAAAATLETLPGALKRSQPKIGAQELQHIRAAIIRRQNQAAGLTLQELGHWST